MQKKLVKTSKNSFKIVMKKDLPPIDYDPYNFLQEDERFVNTAYLIAVDQYAHFPDLSSARGDLSAIGQLLQGDPYNYFVVLGPTDTSKKGLKAFLNHEIGRSPVLPPGKLERVLIYWISHGETVGMESGAPPVGYFIPDDAKLGDTKSYLPMKSLYKALKRRAPHHLLLVLDCCYAGAFKGAYSTKSANHLQYWEQFGRCLERKAWHLMTSASYDEKALDLHSRAIAWERAKCGAQSVFGKAFHEGLMGAADRNNKGLVLIFDLYIYIRDRFLEFRATALQQGQSASTQIRQLPQLLHLPKHDDGEFIFRNAKLPNLAPAPDLTVENNPWKGLMSYSSNFKDIDLYSGRNKFCREVIEGLANNKVLFLTGESGSGKTSFLNAKLKPNLETHYDYEVLIASMLDSEPDASIRKSLTWVENPHDLRDPLVVIFEKAQRTPEKMICLVLDQAEGLIAGVVKERRSRFFVNLATQLKQAPKNFKLLISTRVDFGIHFRNSELGDNWRESSLLQRQEVKTDGDKNIKEQSLTVLSMPRLTIKEIRQCIIGPAEKRSIFFESPALVEALVEEVALSPSSLPLLSFTLSEFYLNCIKKEEKRRTITIGDYRVSGGVAGSVRKKANELYNQLSSPQQVMLERMVIRFVSLEGGEWTKRRIKGDELIFSDDPDGKIVLHVLKELREAGLIVLGASDRQPILLVHEVTTLTSETTVDLSHDALISAWEQVGEWIGKYDNANLILLHQVADAARAWKERKGTLWVGRKTRLREALRAFGV